MDPLDSHPHQCDIDALIRLSNVQNVLLMTNPSTGAIHKPCEHVRGRGLTKFPYYLLSKIVNKGGGGSKMSKELSTGQCPHGL